LTSKSFKVVSDETENVATSFGDVLHTICAELRLSQFQLATLTGYSEAAISRVVNGSRPLSQKLAEKFEEKIGGSADAWLNVYEQTKGQGSGLSVAHFQDYLLGNETVEDLPGTRVRRMHRRDIIDIFGNSDGTMTFRGVTEECEIDPFDPIAVEETSYDTHVGGYYYADRPERESIEEVEGQVIIPPGEVRMIITREHIALPSWLEANLAPAWSIGKKGAFVAHGPIIDPGKWNGRLYVNVFNPTKEKISISTKEPFITLRFEMQDYH